MTLSKPCSDPDVVVPVAWPEWLLWQQQQLLLCLLTNVSVAVASTWIVLGSLEELVTDGAAEELVADQTVMCTVSVLVARTVTGSGTRDVVCGIDVATWLIELIELASKIGGRDVVVDDRDAPAGCIDITAGGIAVDVDEIDAPAGCMDMTAGGTAGIDVVVVGTAGSKDVVVGGTAGGKDVVVVGTASGKDVVVGGTTSAKDVVGFEDVVEVEEEDFEVEWLVVVGGLDVEVLDDEEVGVAEEDIVIWRYVMTSTSSGLTLLLLLLIEDVLGTCVVVVSSDLLDKTEVETVADEVGTESDGSGVGLPTGMTVNPIWVSFSSRRDRSLGEEVGKRVDSVTAGAGFSESRQRDIGPAETAHAKRANSIKN
ncbi:uncharacterized protein N7511_009872 [Penicillium nucicola]|uniref:uncharacterized protein n=1 Tax=Penicillium nucicola TaxID=1850975 RepID=UPI00254518A6|nr:uncharacterized protein N7511_009872 [Penicillium nucicola]KAJ5748176.1 hypothetical protein N7511_009872 [Penicillium nucicola]